MWKLRTKADAPTRSLHSGMHYLDVVPALSRALDVRRYLEVGVSEGIHFAKIRAETAIGVDPRFRIKCDLSVDKGRFQLFKMKSDRFFADERAKAALGGPVDLAFLDGLHLYEFLLRDFINTEAMSHRNAVIILHDCLPVNEAMADRSERRALKRNRGTPLEGFWTGDVWKVVPILQRFRPDLRLLALDCPPSGLICVTNLDPGSQVLTQTYETIVKTFDAMPNQMAEINAMYATLDIVPAAKVLEAPADYFQDSFPMAVVSAPGSAWSLGAVDQS